MLISNKRLIKSEKGFALVLALIAISILIALGALVISLSTGDILESSRMLGDKKALIAAEKGINRLTQRFDPLNLGVINTISDDSIIDAYSKYTVYTPGPASKGPEFVPIEGMEVMGSQQLGLARYDTNVVGENTQSRTRVTIGVGLGYGPVQMGP
ncbi:MAG: hypothetical protein CVU62_05180 [Deltaproteobacteria bacterium HGW-Deltaproteobacteria-2]|nr:MAG: hypothetical protein CVU62_05180 [Deltaproteobacteria bacterium HGW-Deltaproteobacteria-2]